jgi:hypothetical protein
MDWYDGVVKKIGIFFIILAALAAFYPAWVPVQWWTPKTTYAQITDISHPTIKDYARIQKFLSKGQRPELSLLKDMEKRYRGLRIIGDKPDEMPKSGTVYVNCGENEKENCLIVYASFNKNFAQGLQRLVDHVKQTDFKGHILYRIGGWPNSEEGDLKLAHVPFAFKPCFFREAQRLGYQRVLWLDTSILPHVSLNRIFDEIEEKGYFVIRNGHKVGPYMNEQAANRLGVTLEECSNIISCQAGILGLDLSKTSQILADWHAAARDSGAFFSPRSDQNALSIIFYKHGMEEMKPFETLVDMQGQISDATLFTIDRGFVQRW